MGVVYLHHSHGSTVSAAHASVKISWLGTVGWGFGPRRGRFGLIATEVCRHWAWHAAYAARPALRAKLFLKISAPGGHAFKDMEHYKLVDARLEDKLNRLAKRYDYKGDGFYVSYMAWTDKN